VKAYTAPCDRGRLGDRLTSSDIDATVQAHAADSLQKDLPARVGISIKIRFLTPNHGTDGLHH
jgi:hypothetical protein